VSRLLLVSTALLGASEAITVELLRLIGTLIAAAGAVLAAYWARQGRVDARGARREARSRRYRVRDPDRERALVVDQPEQREP
jgi:hypothetical protein